MPSGRGGMWQCAMNGARRRIALCPQYGPQSRLPPRAAERVGAHAEPHAELEDARERAGRRHADHEALQDSQLRLDLHDAHHAQDRLGGLERVRVERDGEVVVAAPAGAEIENVAGLEAGVVGAPPVGEFEAALPLRLQRGEARLLDDGDLRIVGVAQDEDVELVRRVAEPQSLPSSARCCG